MHIANLSNAGAPAPAAGTKASILSGFQQGDISASAHAIANSSPNGQASDALGQLYSSGQRQSRLDIPCTIALQALPDSALIKSLLQPLTKQCMLAALRKRHCCLERFKSHMQTHASHVLPCFSC